MNTKIFVSIYLILLISGVVFFLNISEDKYCLTYDGHTEFIGDTEIYISGLDNSKTEECFNNSIDRNKRLEKIKEYTSMYKTSLPDSINQTHLHLN